MSEKGGMPLKVSKTFTENKDSSYIQMGQSCLLRPRFIHMNNYFVLQIHILKKMYVVSLFRYFVPWFRGFVVYKQPKKKMLVENHNDNLFCANWIRFYENNGTFVVNLYRLGSFVLFLYQGKILKK